MIAAVRGLLEAVGPDRVQVGIGGISLHVLVPASTLQRLPPIGQPVRLYTHLYLREDVVSLYGFLTPDERGLFQQLLEVSGVGPRLALAILSAMSPAAFREAIASEQPERLGAVPGIGRKLASRLILELRGKLVTSESARSAAGAPVDADVVEALMSLGYSAADAQAAVKSLPTDRPLDLEERIRLALQYFVRR
ncbi:MAG: Holliday junction branch migration protein RuvA [Chloroflexi bacterium]|nr:Holliday junction branch migration protein RuvA [Chloroflexota bacterium]